MNFETFWGKRFCIHKRNPKTHFRWEKIHLKFKRNYLFWKKMYHSVGPVGNSQGLCGGLLITNKPLGAPVVIQGPCGGPLVTNKLSGAPLVIQGPCEGPLVTNKPSRGPCGNTGALFFGNKEALPGPYSNKCSIWGSNRSKEVIWGNLWQQKFLLGTPVPINVPFRGPCSEFFSETFQTAAPNNYHLNKLMRLETSMLR